MAENRLTVIRKELELGLALLFGCAVTNEVALSTRMPD